MKTSILILCAIPLHASFAGPRTSASYRIHSDIIDTAGQPAASTSYANAGSAGSVVGLSSDNSPAGAVNAGFIAQLYEVVGFALSDSQSSVPESITLQLQPGHLLDDGTLLAIDPMLVSWNIVHGPIVSISTGGVATAGSVYEDTLATVQGSFGAATALLDLTVLNVNTDDFAGYAGDGIGDDWQVQYFGLPPNAAAGPLLDPDGDTQDNLFEWNAGLVPTDAGSVFSLHMVNSFEGVNLIFGPTFPGRSYTVKYGFDLLDVANWPALPPEAITVTDVVTDSGIERRVTDTSAHHGPRKFYRVEVEK